jgi:GT2 family glycosyltransferase
MRKIPPDYFSGCVLFMHRSVIETVGFFDETFGTYYEDVDFCYRAKKLGIGMESLWDVTARHFHSYSTKGENTHKIYLLNRNQILFARKHLRGLPRVVFIIAAVIRGFLSNLNAKRLKSYLSGIKEGFSIPLNSQNPQGS